MKNRSYKLLLLSFFIVALVVCQPHSSAQTDLTVKASFKPDEPIDPNAQIEIGLSRALNPNERIGILLGTTDLTSLFAAQENRLRYNAQLLPLPSGESKVTIYLVKNGGNWKEIARFPLSVKTPTVAKEQVSENKEPAENPAIKPAAEKPDDEPTKTPESGAAEKSAETAQAEPAPQPSPETRPFGFEKLDFLPAVTLGLKSQPFQSNFPAESRPAQRATFNDFTLQASMKNDVQRGVFGLNSNFDFAGSSNRQEALQFGTLGERAPQVDLASYLMQFKIGKAAFNLGHTSFGSNRHLVNSFSSRGLSVNVPINKRFDITAGFLNGTNLVGFGNFFGLQKIRHQVQGVTLGIEFFPQRPSAMRLEITGFNAYIQPLNGVGEARINDAERSRGGGLRFLTSDKSERLKIEFGYSLSRFLNPQETSRDADGNIVPVPPISRSAHYVDASYQILKNVKFLKDRNINLNASVRYEFVEPLYKSLGASTQADKISQDYALDGSIGDISLQFGHARFNDNLRNVPSILKSLLRANRFAVGVNLGTLLGAAEQPSPFLPRVAYGFDRTHQFGKGIPINGGFEIDLAAIPDQINTNQNAGATWQFTKFNFDYRYSRAFTDNRQMGRETADFLSYVHGVSVGVNPLTKLNFNVGFNFENSRNFEQNQFNRTNAVTFGANWQPFKNAALSGNFSQTLAGNRARTNDNRNLNYDLQFAYNFSLERSRFKKIGMQAFVRYADTLARNRDFVFNVNNLTKTRIVNAGLTFNFF